MNVIFVKVVMYVKLLLKFLKIQLILKIKNITKTTMPMVRMSAVTSKAGKSKKTNPITYICLGDGSEHKSANKAINKLRHYIRLTKKVNNFDPDEYDYLIGRMLYSEDEKPAYIFYESTIFSQRAKICHLEVKDNHIVFTDLGCYVGEKAEEKWEFLKQTTHKEYTDYELSQRITTVVRTYGNLIKK